ncbi:MAG: hypothetical protein M3P06_08725 [Acidobacteriota bacterium]|nr:hypothetical protein [Acidobacteriota bacterium]
MRLSRFLLLIVLAIPASARVISYAPYSDRISRSAHHERTTRWFLLTEDSEVVLYDSAGVHEPRAITSVSQRTSPTALYERKNAPGAPPILLVENELSVDGGLTWKTLNDPYFDWSFEPWDFDTGGPFVHGLATGILPGTDDTPFVIGGGSQSEIRAVHANGDVTILHSYASLAGRNAAGDKFLINASGEILTVDLAGQTTLVTDLGWGGLYTGWITEDGSVYLQAARRDGRYLSFHRNGSRQFVAGPNGQWPGFDSDASPFPEMTSFAIPTHDFEGAWIIQRGDFAPTTLSRHTPERGLEVMWSDPSGPDVEALIAGASGNTLLIQVHRDSPAFQPLPPQFQAFVDPALAVWKVGEPMPARYDELYMREEWNKGFIHVDVDRLESGEPFVFNSGVLDPPVPDVIFSAGGGGDVIQEWGAVRASLRQHLVVPGVARTRGAFDSQWFTDVTIYNPFDEVQNVEIRFAAIGEDDVRAPLPGRSITVALAPQEIRVLDDVLRLFGVDNGGGTLHVLPAKDVNVTSRTYSKSAKGTYGFGMLAIDFYNAAGPHFPLTFTGAFPGEGFRTNVLVTDTSGRGAETVMRAHRGATIVNGQTIVTPANGTAQLNGIDLTPDGPIAAAQRSGALRIETRRGTTIPLVVAIDNRTNDPLYVSPDLDNEVPRMIPAIGHLDGAHGARFRTDLYLFNKESTARAVVLEAIPWGSATGGSRSVSLSLRANETQMIPDALMTLFGLSGIARLRFTAGVYVTSRTYSVDASGATYGCLIPPLNAFQTASQNERLEIMLAAGEGFRTNLAIVRAAERAALSFGQGQIEIYDDAGFLLDRRSFELRSKLGMQINDILAPHDGLARRAARIVVEVQGPDALAAYATVVDNATNDTTYYAGQLGAKN